MSKSTKPNERDKEGAKIDTVTDTLDNESAAKSKTEQTEKTAGKEAKSKKAPNPKESDQPTAQEHAKITTDPEKKPTKAESKEKDQQMEKAKLAEQKQAEKEKETMNKVLTKGSKTTGPDQASTNPKADRVPAKDSKSSQPTQTPTSEDVSVTEKANTTTVTEPASQNNISTSNKDKDKQVTTAPQQPTTSPRPELKSVTPISDAQLESLIQRHLSGRKEDARYYVMYQGPEIEALLSRAKEVISKQPMLVELRAPVLICGDIHGQFPDLLRIFEICGQPTQHNYLFLGDYIDRGPFSLEVIVLLLALKCRYPRNIYLLRGNHELEPINQQYGFYAELLVRIAPKRQATALWARFNDLFNWMPVSAVVGARILCMHGGMSPHLNSLDDIRRIKRPLHTADLKENVPLACDLLWADPDTDGKVDMFGPNKLRGLSVVYSKKALAEKLNKLGLDVLCRAHQVVQDGYELWADRRHITVFSAPKYCGDFDNAAAVVRVSKTLECHITQMRPKLPLLD